MTFLTELDVSYIDNGKNVGAWTVKAPLVYASKVAHKTFTVPTGFVTDFSSVPRLPFVFWLTGDTAQEAAVVHDWLYSTGEVDRATADSVFLEAMEETGIPWWRRRIIYAGVRVFGASHYKQDDTTGEANAEQRQGQG